jgi:hypothetical protein
MASPAGVSRGRDEPVGEQAPARAHAARIRPASPGRLIAELQHFNISLLPSPARSHVIGGRFAASAQNLTGENSTRVFTVAPAPARDRVSTPGEKAIASSAKLTP